VCVCVCVCVCVHNNDGLNACYAVLFVTRHVPVVAKPH